MESNTNEVASRGPAGANTPYGTWPIANILCLADGKLFTMGGHLYSPPLFNGGELIAWNATTGEKVWSDLSFAITNRANGVLADGYLVVPNAYDNQLYCYAKGQSAVTVSAPNTVIPRGTSVLITGTVTDQSPGQTCLRHPSKRHTRHLRRKHDSMDGVPLPATAKANKRNRCPSRTIRSRC